MRTKIQFLTIIAVVLLGIAASGAAFAQHGGHGGYGHGGYGHGGYGRGGFGVYVGVPLYSPWYYPPVYYAPPYPYYPPTVISSPPVYVEQQAASPVLAPAAPAPQADYWYYCGASKAYYPYVKECPGGWQRVAPQRG